MANHLNPFLERMSERTVSDIEFVNLFSPKILENLNDNTLEGGVHIFRSAPGAGKTTLLRAFTPTALRAFWGTRNSPDFIESIGKLKELKVIDEQAGPQISGVLLSCASGYADLPRGANITQDGLFRALLDCRIVLRTLRSIAVLVGRNTPEKLENIYLKYKEPAADLKNIPLFSNANELILWAEQYERKIYTLLDSFIGQTSTDMPSHVQFEGTLWLQSVQFFINGECVAPKRLLMIDDLHKLRKKQRDLLIDELTVQRSGVPIWLAERKSALGVQLLSQGIRQGRDLSEHDLEEMWSSAQGTSLFNTFAQNILDRRMLRQDVVTSKSFSNILRSELEPYDISKEVKKGVEVINKDILKYRDNVQYSKWIEQIEQREDKSSINFLTELYILRILLARDELKKQLQLFDFPLSINEFEDRVNSQVKNAALIFIHNDLKIPYYFGIEKLYTMASWNVEELLSLAAALYEGLQDKRVLRKPELILAPNEQEKLLKEVAKRKRDFIPKNHTEGMRAQRLLDSIGAFCKERTMMPNAPYAPGVTGVRLSQSELNKLSLDKRAVSSESELLNRVLSECVAENLLIPKPSSASHHRECGTIFYLNRTLCVYYNLPLQLGGWQDITMTNMIEWIECGTVPNRRQEAIL